MPKEYKIKRRYSDRSSTFKAKPRPFSVIVTLVVVVGLVFIGVSAYEPVAGFINQQLTRDVQRAVPPPEPTPPTPTVDPAPPLPPAEPEPPPFPERPELINAVFMNHETASNPDMWESFLEAVIPEFNTVMVEVKNADGYVLFNTSNQSALTWGAVSQDAVDLSALSEFLRESELYLAVSMSAFLDPIAARGDRLNNAVMHGPTGQIWLDNALDLGGRPWLSPFSAPARDYLMQIALEAADKGAVLVMFEHYHFPSDPSNSANFGDTAGMTRSQVLSTFANEMHEALQGQAVRFAVLMPSWVTGYPVGNFSAIYGGNPADITYEIVLDLDLSQLPADSFSQGADILAARLPEWLGDRPARVLGMVTETENAYAVFQLGLWEDVDAGILEFIIR